MSEPTGTGTPGDPHEGHDLEITSCDDVLSHVFEFLDHETDDHRRAVIAEHLEDCSPCLRQFGIEQEFKALVRRRCGGDPTPLGLRDRIKMQLTHVSFEEDGTSVSIEQVSVETTTYDGDPGRRPSA
jgi:mycothiol system anti-sigma-R factor